EAFVQRMNELAHRLGLKDTHFADVHGLGSAEHYTSAWDLALLSEHAMTLPEFRAVVGSETHVASGTRELSLYNLNPLLNYTPGVDGVKTGYTEEAGPTFVASAERDGHRITVVLLDAPSMALDAIALIEWAFRNFEWPP
ncbi:MAG: D-alanyl-D-alanine carboxypeptidase, partial [Vicinamibacteria bacterium]